MAVFKRSFKRLSADDSATEKTPLASLGPAKPKRGRVPVLIVHGGAGTISREGHTKEEFEAYREGLRTALRAGNAVLERGGNAMEAVCAAVVQLENNPLFNAGKGAVFNSAGQNELEASLMLSHPPSSSIPATRRGAAATLLQRTKNPILLARALYLSSSENPHVFLCGFPAEELGASRGVELVDPSYFWTEKRWREHTGAEKETAPMGTVGAVALDAEGAIAAATSTGGITNKLPGRIGDTPSMGSGFWAETWTLNQTGSYACSVASAQLGLLIAQRMKLLGESLEKSAKKAIDELGEGGGSGGVISVDEEGRFAMLMNSTGMYRGVARPGEAPKVAIFADEALA